jgi:HD-like signal output (HDOD) protein
MNKLPNLTMSLLTIHKRPEPNYLRAYKASAIYVPIRHLIRHRLYICRENSTNQPSLFKTNPIFRKAKMNISAVDTNGYENSRLGRHNENKPNSNPNKPNSNPIKANKMSKQTQYKPNQTQFQTGHLLVNRMKPNLQFMNLTVLNDICSMNQKAINKREKYRRLRFYEPAFLRAKKSIAAEEKMNTKKELSQRITQLVDGLPLFPTDIDKLLSAAVKPSADGAELLRLIEHETKLRTELLKLAHSYFGLSEDIQTIDDAVRQVGIQPLVQLIGISYARHVIQDEFASLKYLNEYVNHSEEVSISCRILAEITGMERNEREVHALAGLIHDVGRLAILVASDRTGAHVLGTLWDKMSSVLQKEKARVGTNHCEVGMQICRKWNLSPVIQEGVLRHHTPLIDSDFSFTGALIFVSHFISASDPSGEIISSSLPREIMTRLKLTGQDFDKAKELYKSRTQTGSS